MREVKRKHLITLHIFYLLRKLLKHRRLKRHLQNLQMKMLRILKYRQLKQEPQWQRRSLTQKALPKEPRQKVCIFVISNLRSVVERNN